MLFHDSLFSVHVCNRACTNVLLFHFVNPVPNTLYLSAVVNVALPCCHQNVLMLTLYGMTRPHGRVEVFPVKVNFCACYN